MFLLDKNMQLNEARFMQNGKCGYVLKPSFLLKSSDYNPYAVVPTNEDEPLSVYVKVCTSLFPMTPFENFFLKGYWCAAFDEIEKRNG